MSQFLQLAPMQALTDVPFMNSYHRHFGGFTEMMAPYIMASNISPIKATKLQKHFQGLRPEIKLVPQLLSNDAEGFLHFANSLFDLGYQKVNWNLGCPYPAVTKKQRGSGLLPYPQKIAAILEQLCPKLKPELSVKIRLGYHSNQEIFPIIEVLNQYPVAETIIHPRTASQLYGGQADRSFFCSLFPLLKMPVVYNGDIVQANYITGIQEKCPGIKGYMIGRGAFINPFIAQQLQGITINDNEKLERYRNFYFDLHSFYQEHSSHPTGFLHHMKELWSLFSQSFQKGESYLFALKSINDPEVFKTTAENIFKTGRLAI